MLSNESMDSKELSLNWRDRNLLIEECIVNRGDTYNGYPNCPSYFGSYCIDGLAIALNAFKFGWSVESSLKICIDHLGDCDSTASITGTNSIYYYYHYYLLCM